MRRIFIASVLGLLALSNTGCLLNMWSSDPNIRMSQMLNASEDLRNFEAEWRRFWMTDQPSHLTPTRTHGGIAPGI